MSLICTVPADANPPTPPAAANSRKAHRQRSRNTGQEITASPPEAKVLYVGPRPLHDLGIALPTPTPATLAGGRNRSKRRRAMILVTRAAQTRQATGINYAAGPESHLELREGVDRDPQCASFHSVALGARVHCKHGRCSRLNRLQVA